MYQPVDGPIKWPGGKAYLAREIVKLMPPRCKNPNKPSPRDKGWLHYVEPYFGGGRVLLEQDPEGISEVVADTNRELAFFWHVLSDSRLFEDFKRRVEATPFSEELWQKATTRLKHGLARMPTDAAADFFVRCRQSMSGRLDSFAPRTRNRVRRGMNEQVSAWLSAIEGLPAVHARMMRVLVLCAPALKVIDQEDGPRTLFYLDPPYLHTERQTTTEYGDHEMSHADHVALLQRLTTIKGRFLLSGYRSDLYDLVAGSHGWRRVEFNIANHASSSKSKKRMTECVWMNY